jgi:hypothetical protein
MKVYRMNRSGFIEELNTDGNYKPTGWSTSRAAAKRRANRNTKPNKRV